MIAELAACGTTSDSGCDLLGQIPGPSGLEFQVATNRDLSATTRLPAGGCRRPLGKGFGLSPPLASD